MKKGSEDFCSFCQQTSSNIDIGGSSANKRKSWRSKGPCTHRCHGTIIAITSGHHQPQADRHCSSSEQLRPPKNPVTQHGSRAIDRMDSHNSSSSNIGSNGFHDDCGDGRIIHHHQHHCLHPILCSHGIPVHNSFPTLQRVANHLLHLRQQRLHVRDNINREPNFDHVIGSN